MNIYKFELKMLRKSIFLWGLFVPLGLVFYLSFFPMMEADIQGYEAIMNSFPEEFLAFFGMSPELPMTRIDGYLNLTYAMIQIPLAIQAANYGFHMLSVEERELTADFLLTKPVSRTRIIVSKFLAAFTSLTIVNVIMWVSTIVSVILFDPNKQIEMSHVVVLLSTNVFIQLYFLSIGMVISVLLKKIPSVIGFSMGFGFGMYILASLGAMLRSDLFKLLTPFAHFSPDHILINGSYNWGFVWISFVIIIVSLIGSYFLYQRRNIASL